MPEGLSPSELGKEIAEHRHMVEEQEQDKEQGEKPDTEAKGQERWLTITEAVLLAVVAILAAWSGFASAKWSTHSSLSLAKASAARTEANRADYEAANLMGFDSTMFDAWFTAYVAHDKAAMRVAEGPFPRPSLSNGHELFGVVQVDATAPVHGVRRQGQRLLLAR
jgi:hypothetical protein